MFCFFFWKLDTLGMYNEKCRVEEGSCNALGRSDHTLDYFAISSFHKTCTQLVFTIYK